MIPRTITTLSALVLFVSSGLAQVDPDGRSLLFVRGANGSGGLGAGSTEQLSDLFNDATTPNNHGFGALRVLLQADGFTTSQHIESATAPMTLAMLLPHRAVVMGSNNRVYSAAEVAAFHAYIDMGGSALFMSDANWGPTWGAAPDSDNQFLGRYGAQVYQDSGQIPMMMRSDPGRYIDLDDPVLSGPGGAGGGSDLNNFTGEGVSLFAITTGSAGYQAQAAVTATGLNKRLNTSNGSQGMIAPAGPGDTVLFTCEQGDSRVVGCFDRNTFFNPNGAGASLLVADNGQLALNVFRFLVAVEQSVTPIGTGCGTATTSPSLTVDPLVMGTTPQLVLQGAESFAPSFLLASPPPSGSTPLGGGCTLHVGATGLQILSSPVTSATGGWALSVPLGESPSLAGLEATLQVISVNVGGPLAGLYELSQGVEVRIGYPR